MLECDSRLFVVPAVGDSLMKPAQRDPSVVYRSCHGDLFVLLIGRCSGRQVAIQGHWNLLLL